MKKIISIVFIVIGIISISIGVGIVIIKNNNETKRLENLKTSIINDYNVFKTKIESFSTERINVYENLNEISYLTELSTKYDNLINEYKKYEQIVKDIDEVSKDLKVNCFKETFNETDVNNKISAFVINYEQAINYFVQDVKVLNDKIENYNKWIDDNQSDASYTKLEKYKSSYVEYVDIDNDGKYNGVKE